MSSSPQDIKIPDTGRQSEISISSLANDGRLAWPDFQKLLASAALHTSPYFRDFGNIASPLSVPFEINRCVLSAI